MYPYEIISHLADLRLLDYSAQPLPGATVDDFSPLERERLRTTLRTFGGDHLLKAMVEKNSITLLHSGRYARYVLADGYMFLSGFAPTATESTLG